MAVIALKTEPRCKICTSAHRIAIDELLELRSNKQSVDGERVNLEYVLTKLGELGIVNPTEDNVKTHWRKHSQKVSEGQALQKQEEFVAELQELIERDPRDVDVEGWLRRQIQIVAYETEKRLREGRPSGVTLDHALKSAAELSKRGQNEAAADLLKAVTGGIAQSFSDKALGIDRHKELEAEDIVDVEAVDAS